MPTTGPSASGRLAVIDVGTNAIRLTIAGTHRDGTPHILQEQRETVRLGENLAGTGRLSQAAIERGLEAIGRLKAIADDCGVEQLKAVATSALREAANGREFIQEVSRRYGIRLDVISGDEEAQLAFLSAAGNFDLRDHSTAVVDIGGGSVEVILSRGATADHVYSLPLGAVRLTERLLRSDPVEPGSWRLLQEEISRTIRAGFREPHRAENMIGSGGTFTSLARMSQAQRAGRQASIQGYELAPAEVERFLGKLLAVPLEARRQIPGLSTDRADIIVAGVAVAAGLAAELSVQRILVNERGIRDGLLRRMIAELQRP